IIAANNAGWTVDVSRLGAIKNNEKPLSRRAKMDCPKCNSAMQELKIETLHGQVVIDKRESCSGLWFDIGEAEQLKGDWMAEFADSGDPEVGKSYNTVRDIQCPRCGKTMKSSMTPSKSILNTKHAKSTACLWMQGNLPITNT
ncbi:MAG: zf-TFIIB domain-containing protein, partial [Pseudomonadota bacterium]|nr:zf-TFIIB domain-containing protein [Pseudomonadota bacterium]